MNPDKDKDLYINYTISWKQNYQAWSELVDIATECLLESSDMEEAKEIIERIKNGNNRKT